MRKNWFVISALLVMAILGCGSDVSSQVTVPQVTVPVVSITSATIISPRTVKITGEIISTGGESIAWLGVFCEPEGEKWYKTYYDRGERYEAGSFDVTVWKLTEGSTSQCGVFAENSAGYGYSTNRITVAIPPIENPKTVVDTFSLDWSDAYPHWFADYYSHSEWDVENRTLEIILDTEKNSNLSDENHAAVVWNYSRISFLNVSTSSIKYGDQLDFTIEGTAIGGEEVTLKVIGIDDGEQSNLYAETKFIFGEKIPSLTVKPLLNKPIQNISVHLEFGNTKAGKYFFPEKIYLTRTRTVPTSPPKKPVNMAPIYLLLLGS